MNCTTCNGPMKVLFSSWYCPRDCDRKGAGFITSNGDPDWLDGRFRVFTWRGKEWKVGRVAWAAAQARTWYVDDYECKFLDWTQDRIEDYASQQGKRGQWDDDGPGRIKGQERAPSSNSMALWQFVPVTKI